MRSYEDISEELQNLRDQNREAYAKLNEEREKNKVAMKELEWWRKTFGPEAFA